MGKLLAVAALFALTFGGWFYIKSHPEIITNYFHIRSDQPGSLVIVPESPRVVDPSLVAITEVVPAEEPGKIVYRWVDERGGVHYGDKPPPRHEHATQLRRLELEPLPEITIETPSLRVPTVSTPPPSAGGSLLPPQQVDDPVAVGAGSLCASYTKELEALRARMRVGYQAHESGRLLDRERYLRERVAAHCH